MPLVLADRVRETTTTTGTGTISLAGPVSGFQGFSTAIGNANTTYYTIVDAATGAWEVGLGTYTSSGSTLARTTVLSSSNSDALVPFASGVKDVFVTQPAERAVYVLGAGTGLAAGAAAFTANGVPYADSTSTLATGANLTYAEGGSNQLTVTSASASYFTSTVGANTSYFGTNGTGTYVGSGTNVPVVFYQNNTEGMRLTSSGLSLTANPTLSGGTANGVAYLNGSKVLTTGSALSFDGANLQIGTTSALSAAAGRTDLTINGSSIGAIISFGNGGVRRGYIWQDGTDLYIANQPNGSAIFITNNAEAMRLTSTGLGIGTSSPGYKLDVAGSTSTARLGKLTITNDAPFVTGANIDAGSNSFALGTSGAASAIFFTNNTERMRLDASGNFGIGTSSPSSFSGYTTVSVNNATNGGIYNILVNGTETARLQAYSGIFNVAAKGAATNLTFETNGAERMRLDTSGNLGLGVTPTTKLQINTTAASTASISTVTSFGANAVVSLGKIANNSEGVYLGTGTVETGVNGGIAAGIGFLREASGWNSALAFYTNGTTDGVTTNRISERMRIDSSGNLGLGVTPSAWMSGVYTVMDVGAASSFGGFSAGASGDELSFMATNAFFNSSNTPIYKASGLASNYRQFNGVHQWYTAPSGTAGNAISFTQAMDLANSAGASTLTVNSEINTASAVRLTTTGGLTAGMFLANPTVDHSLGFQTAGTEKARITSGGDLLVGTTSALTSASGRGNVTINGTDAVLAFGNSNSSAGYVYAASTNLEISAASTRYINFLTNGSERARITSGGEFVIGATAAVSSEKLYVNGSNTEYLVRWYNTNASPKGLVMSYTGAAPNGTGNAFFRCDDTGALRAEFRSNGGLANYSANDVNLSDRREKTNFAPAKSYLETICAIPVQTFNYIDQSEDDPGLTLGVVAQDVQAVAPELVMESNWGTEDNPKMRLSIYQTDLQYALMKALQELKAEFDAYKATHP